MCLATNRLYQNNIFIEHTLVKFNQDYGHRLSNTFLVRLTRNSMLEINQENVESALFWVKFKCPG